MRTLLCASLFVLSVIAPAFAQDPCTASQPIVLQNVPFKVQYCHPGGELVEGTDIVIDNGTPATVTPQLLGSATDGRKIYQISIMVGLLAGQHTVKVTSWNFKRDTDNKPTTEKQYSSPTTATVAVVAPKFTIGQRVESWKCPSPEACSKYGDGIAVREAPSFSSPIMHVHAPGMKGTVVAGPMSANDFVWWQVNFDTDPDGWGTETNLIPATVVEDKDCVGAWTAWNPVPPGDWSACVNGNQTRMEQRTFIVSQPATGTGKACEAANGTVEKREVSQSCTVNKDCVGSWSEWTPIGEWSTCVDGSQSREETRTFTVKEPATGTGKACEAANGATEKRTATQSCTVSGVSAPVPTQCRVNLQAQPPDTTFGWRGQWRRDGVATGPQDTSAPVERQFNLSTGTYTFDVVWTKTGVASQTSAVLVMKCQ